MRTCTICAKLLKRPLADCPHPGHQAKDVELLERPDIIYAVDHKAIERAIIAAEYETEFSVKYGLYDR